MYFFFDTETTGLWDFKADDLAEHQPRMVQIGAMVTDGEGNTMQEFNTLVYPDGWEVDESGRAFETHQKTQAMCMKYGMPVVRMMDIVAGMIAPCTTVVAHNLNFDTKLMKGEGLRLGFDHSITKSDRFEQYCTMLKSMGILKIPGRYGGYKWPSLQELHKHYFGEEFEDAHDAMADIRATAKCFFAIKNGQGPFNAV